MYSIKYNHELMVTKIDNFCSTYFKLVRVFVYKTSSDKFLTIKLKNSFATILKLRCYDVGNS